MARPIQTRRDAQQQRHDQAGTVPAAISWRRSGSPDVRAAAPKTTPISDDEDDVHGDMNEPELGAVDPPLEAEQKALHCIPPQAHIGPDLIRTGPVKATLPTPGGPFYSVHMTLQRAALWAIVIAATIYLLVAGRGLLLPFVLGLVLWYMVDALADAFEQPRLGASAPAAADRAARRRPASSAACSGCVGRTIGRNVTAVIAAAPNYEGRLQTLITAGRHDDRRRAGADARRAVRPHQPRRHAGQRRHRRRLGRQRRRHRADLCRLPVRRAGRISGRKLAIIFGARRPPGARAGGAGTDRPRDPQSTSASRPRSPPRPRPWPMS